MAITNASRVADFGSGIGTEGAVLQVDNTNKRIGIGTTNPQAMLQVGTAVTVYGNSGIVSATKFYGDGSNITNAGSTLAAGSGAQRVVVTSLTTGTMTSAASHADLSWNSSTSTLGVTSVSATNLTGALIGNVTGNVTGDASGSSGSCTGNAATATLATNASGLSGTPNITINNLVGVAATFSGVVTYEDVTNIDSVGIVTARGGFEIGASGVGGTITSAGAATFEGNLEQGDTSTTAGGTLISDGTVYCRMDGSRPSTAKALVIYPSNTFTGPGNASIGADGAATFNGDVTIGVGGTITSVGNAEFAGICTVSTLKVGTAATINSSGLDVVGIASVGVAITMYGSSGIVSATSFYGDGQYLDNVSASGGGETDITSCLFI